MGGKGKMNHSVLGINASADDQRSLANTARGQGRNVPQNGFAEVMARERSMPNNNFNGTLNFSRSALAGRTPSDIARMQVYNKAQTDMQRASALEQISQLLSPRDNSNSANIARQVSAAQNLRGLAQAQLGQNVIDQRPRHPSQQGQQIQQGQQVNLSKQRQAQMPQETRQTSSRTVANNNNGQNSSGQAQISTNALDARSTLGTIRELQRCDFIRTRTVATRNNIESRVQALRQRRKNMANIGSLSAQFESGKEDIAAIGYDQRGGTSYGRYQIASRVGSMSNFLKFLDSNGAKDLSERLRAAGPANTGSRKGKMPTEWRKIAQEQPERFAKLQEDFISDNYFQPALASIDANTRLKARNISNTLREVIWSTAVQHGPSGAAELFSQADAKSGRLDRGYERRLIRNLYNLRAGQFENSSQSVKEAVQNRLQREKDVVLHNLKLNMA